MSMKIVRENVHIFASIAVGALLGIVRIDPKIGISVLLVLIYPLYKFFFRRKNVAMAYRIFRPSHNGLVDSRFFRSFLICLQYSAFSNSGAEFSATAKYSEALSFSNCPKP